MIVMFPSSIFQVNFDIDPNHSIFVCLENTYFDSKTNFCDFYSKFLHKYRESWSFFTETHFFLNFRILWTLITLAMAIFCSASIPTIFHPYRNETIFTLADNAVPLNTIAHPAVTICSNNRISKSKQGYL